MRWQTKTLLTLTALVATIGLRLALTPWLEGAHPVTLGVPAVATVAYLCGTRWAFALAALVVAWASVPWLPPNWPPGSLARQLPYIAGLFAAALVGLLRRAPPARSQRSIAPAPGALPRELYVAQHALQFAMVVALTLPLVLLGVLAWISHDAAHAKAQQQAESAARVAAQHVLRVVETKTFISRQVVRHLESFSPQAIVDSQSALSRYLGDLVRGVPQINSVWILGADGYPIASSLFDPAPRINYSDREYFTFHQAHRGQIYVSRLLRTRSTQELFFDVSARWEDSSGRFLGVINVTLNPQYFLEFYREIAQSYPAISIMLMRSDGFILARWPRPPEVGERLAQDGALARALIGGASASWVQDLSDESVAGDAAVIHKLDPFPLHVGVALDSRIVRRTWTHEVASLGAVIISASLMLLGALWIALRRTHRELAALERLSSESEQRVRAEQALRESQKLEALGLLTGGVAHDFNNLLGVIQNNMHVLRVQAGALAESPAFAGMQRALKSGEQLTRKLLAFARRQALRPEVVDLAQSLPQIADMLRSTVGSAIEMRVEVAADTPRINVDRSEFEIALLNLATNARGALGANGRIDILARAATASDLPAEFARSAVARSGFVIVSMRDNGSGMTAAVRDRAFDPFFTTKAHGEGTGLGLSQVYGFCVQAGGTTNIVSTPGQGTTVTMILPATDATPSTTTSSDAPPAPDTYRVDANVLLVEDNPELGGATAALLESMGARVMRALDAQDAERIVAAQRERLDLVFSDIVMPGAMNGMDLALKLQTMYPDLPIVLTTGHASQMSTVLDAGFSVLQKPTSPAALAAALNAALAAKSPIEAAPQQSAV